MRLIGCVVAAAFGFSAVSPVLADNTSLPLIAKLLGGLANGGEMLQGSLGKGAVKAIGEGAFEVTFATGVVSFLYDEPDTCVFTQHVQMNGDASDARMDFTKVTAVDVRDQGVVEGLNSALVTFEGPADLLQVVMGGDLVAQQPAFAFLASSVTVEELSAVATELQRIC